MRLVSALAGVIAFGLAQAVAAPVTLTPVGFSPEFQNELEEELGTREGALLSRLVHEEVSQALAERGASLSEGAPLVIELSIVDARPNRPTMEQLGATPGLDMRSVSIGGAELHAVLRDRSGAVVGEVNHRRYNHSLDDLNGAATTWTEARRAIRQFADKVADAYVDNAR